MAKTSEAFSIHVVSQHFLTAKAHMLATVTETSEWT